MEKIDFELALKGAPVKLRNGLKAVVKKYDDAIVFVYSGYVAGESESRCWTKQGREYCASESPYDIVSMWEDKEQEDKLEAGKDTEENIFEKALNINSPLRHLMQRDSVPDFYCIAKTLDGDYILEREDRGTKLTIRLSNFSEDLDWYIVEPERSLGSIPKAFMPKEGEEFWYVSPTYQPYVRREVYTEDEQTKINTAENGVAFRTKEDAMQMLLFLKQNIERSSEDK